MGDAKRILAVGDVHGYIDALDAVLYAARYDAQHDVLILLGDYVDRGPDSAAVLDKVIDLVKNGAIALMGNHEQIMIDAAASGYTTLWDINGGTATRASYTVGDWKRHLTFVKSLPLYYQIAHADVTYVFVHAGIDPDRPIQEQGEDALLWHPDFYRQHVASDIVYVAGHRRVQHIRRELGQFPEDTPIFRPNQIFLDTGVDNGHKLTICDVVSRRYWQA